MPFWPNTKLNRTVRQTADVTEAVSTNPVDIPGLSVDLPRAGTYHVTGVFPYTAADGTSRTMGVGLTFSGSTTLLTGQFGIDVSAPNVQSASGTLASRTSQTGTAGRWWCQVVVVVSTGGTLKMQFSRSAASITHTSGVMTVREAG